MIAAQPLDLYGSEAVFFVVSQAAQARVFCRVGAHNKIRLNENRKFD